ncbi:MAG TPA: SCO family protein [Oleiagrimonas sp.]|nr:SCO family protein [Oleiagrimonas sp.]
MNIHRRTRRLILPGMLLALSCAVMVLGGCSSHPSQLDWKLNSSIRGHLPDLKFQLTNDNGKTTTAEDFRGKVAIVFFGYTHCPDVCPLTMTHLHMVMQKLGPLADDARILFISVDPARDTPEVLHQYVKAFDKHAVGLTGSEDQIKRLAKRYRVAFNRGPSNGHGGYEVNHSSAIYIFDEKGHASLLATPVDTPDDMAHDVRQLITQEHAS